MPGKNRTTVRIAGREYSLVSDESDEYMQKVAMYVNKKMAETYKNNNKLSTMMVAVLTSLNIADEHLRNTELVKSLEDALSKSNAELESLRTEYEKLKETNEGITNDYNNLKLELVKKETEINTLRNDIILKS